MKNKSVTRERERDRMPAQAGLAALLSVVIIGAVALVIVAQTVNIGLGELDTLTADNYGSAALNLAEGCIEETIRRWQIDPQYDTESEFPILEGGSCTVMTEKNETVYNVTATGKINNYYQTVRAEFLYQDGDFSLISWQENPS